jgi:exopolysaccharide biosynthesis polyprenyl glycosylphosphotransferase
MSVLVAKLLTFRQELAIELQRFVLLWRYQHHVPPFTLWWRLVLKRCVDFAAAVVGLVLVAPVLAAVALAVKLGSKGPAVYAQERVGRFGETFNMYKFRTMRVDAESNGPVWATLEGDPRVTRVGAFLRRTHLDELPQLFNVLKGDMSLVGPRPERPHFVEQLDREVPRYDERLLIKPGMTGLAQVHYRYDQTIEDVKKKLRFDLLYVKRMCLMLDARILAWTVLVVITGRGIK